jgi:hypothetical protein
MGDDFRAWEEAKKTKRKKNMEESTALLIKAGIPFNSKNGGVHLKVKVGDQLLDFWPSTGLVMQKGKMIGRGVHKILKLAKQQGQ